MDPTSEPAEREADIMTSLCMNCHEDGTTRLLITRIPFFREVILASFSCPHCHFNNTEVQSAGEIQQRGVSFTFKISDKADLERQIVKSDTAVFKILDLDLEIPPGRGQLSNIEGLLSMVQQDLAMKQEERRQLDEGLHQKIQDIINALREMCNGRRSPFTISIDDPAGNSSIEPSPSDAAGKYRRAEYPRTAEQNASLGLAPYDQETNTEPTTDTIGTSAPPTDIRPEYHTSDMTPSLPPSTATNSNINRDGSVAQNINDIDDIIENEVYSFPSTCPGCTRPCATNMKMVRIPHFSEVILMSTVCQYCGYRSNEVKSGGEVPARGRRITLHVQRPEDLSRDILKAEHCALRCDELSLTVEPGTLGGRFTTVEGLLAQVRDDLRSSIFDIGDDNTGGGKVIPVGGDSMQSSDKVKWTSFFAQLDRGIKGEMPFTVVLEDPLAASYVQSLTAPEPDPQIQVEEYERTEEEEENLGLRDILTEGYADADGKIEGKDGVNPASTGAEDPDSTPAEEEPGEAEVSNR